MSCPNLETVAAWLLNELSEQASLAFEEHYFDCDACLERVEAIERTLRLLGESLPPILTEARRKRVEQSRHPVPVVHVQPDQRSVIRLNSSAPVGLWVLHADLARAARVDLTAFDSGQQLIALTDIPFDRERGEVVMPCHTHYRGISQSTLLELELQIVDEAGRRVEHRYYLDHDFA